MASYLKIIFDDIVDRTTNTDNYEYRNKPFANSSLYKGFVEGFRTLTHGEDVKTTYELKLTLNDASLDYVPGDVIAVLPENDEEEVRQLLKRLQVEDVCHNKYRLEVLKETTKKNATISKHLPPNSTLYNLFLKYIDIRTVPKKLFLKNLLKFTRDPTEKQKLELICSAAGSNEYVKLLADNRSLLSLLNSFPSCHPPIELILEHSVPLNPRYYSVASSPLSNQLSIIFFVMELENGLKGVCTSWLEKIIKDQEFKTIPIPIYFKKPGNFRFNNVNTPNILVAAGTGLAPFLSFLQHKKLLGNSLTETWLFYGCRYSTRDFLCREELGTYLDEGVLMKLYTAFSRESEKKEYVQQRIAERKEEVIDFLLNKEAVMYVCGDAKTVVKDIKELLIKCFMECRNTDRTSAEDIISNLTKNGQFLVDSWI